MIFLGKNIKYLRKVRGISQAELADYLAVRANTISNYENSISTPDYEILAKLIKKLDVNSNDLLFTDIENGSKSNIYSEKIPPQSEKNSTPISTPINKNIPPNNPNFTQSKNNSTSISEHLITEPPEHYNTSGICRKCTEKESEISKLKAENERLNKIIDKIIAHDDSGQKRKAG